MLGILRGLAAALAALSAILAVSPAGASPTAVRQVILTRPATVLGLAMSPALEDFDFGAAATLLTGRVIPGGPTWVMDADPGHTVTNCMTLNGVSAVNGFAGSPGANCAFGFQKVTIPAPGAVWVASRTNPNAVIGHATLQIGAPSDWIKSTGTGTWLRFQPTWAASGITGLYRNAIASGAGNLAPTSQQGFTSTNLELGDTNQRHYRQASGSWVLDNFINGQQFSSGVVGSAATGDITAMGIDTSSPSFGFQGALGQGSSTNAQQLIDLFEVGDPTVASMIMAQANVKVAPVDPTGVNAQFLFNGLYSGNAPAATSYTIFTTSTGLPVAGLTNVPLTGITAAGGAFSFAPVTIPTASLPSNFFYQICRTDVTPGTACSKSGTMSPGVQYMGIGQSNMTNLEQATTGGSASGLTNMWQQDAAYCGACANVGTSPLDGRLARITDSSPLSTMASIYQTNRGATPFNFLRGGFGGTRIDQRLPGSDAYNWLADVLKGLANGRVRGAIIKDGEFDADGSTLSAAYVANQLTILRGYKAQIGNYQACLSPVGSFWPSNINQDPAWEQMRRQQTKMTVDWAAGDATTPPIAHCGLDMEKNHVDNFHSTNAGYVTQATRAMFNEIRAETGTASYARLGGVLVSASFVSSTQIDAVFAVDSAVASADVTNKATSADKAGGGLWFHQSPAFVRSALGCSSCTTPLPDHVPDTVTCAAPSGGFQTCSFGWAAAPFTAGQTGYISGPWGAEPFNPRHDLSYHSTEATKQSVLTFTYGDGTTATVRPYYNFATGNDYITTSNTAP